MKNIYDIWFSSLDIENNIKLELLEKYSTEEIWNFKKKDFKKFKLEEYIVLKIINSKNIEEYEKILNYMEEKQIKLISVRDENYPWKLHQIEDKPAFLYVRGDEKILDDDSIRNSWL